MAIYKTLEQPCEFCYEEKKSRFIAQLWPVKDKANTTVHLDEAKQRFPDARHHCWAYLFGNPEQALSAGFNDDGEPGGTAGKPMLNVLMQRKVGDVYSVVSRYFGGIKLGAGGLTRAYGQAVSGALDLAQFIDVVPMLTVNIVCQYPYENGVRMILAQCDAQDITVHYGEDVTLHCQVPIHSKHELEQSIRDATSGDAHLKWPT